MAFPLAPSTSPGTGNLQKLPREDAEGRAALEIKVEALVTELTKEADRRVTDKRPLEQRWIEEIYQYHGRYMRHEEEAIMSAETMIKSRVYLNETRRRTDSIEDRLVDIEFPTDDRNFSIEATPVPELNDEASAWARFAAENQQQLLLIQEQQPAPPPQQPQDPNNPVATQPMQPPAPDPAAQEAIAAQNEALKRATDIQAIIDEAAKRAEFMQTEMDDQLTECMYNHECKMMIHDAVLLGTGIIKGPVLNTKSRKAWSQATDEASGFTVHAMVEEEEPRPAFYRVDPWNWFPDMDANSLGDSEGFFERHLMTASALRKLARVDGFNADVIRKLLKQKPKGTAPQYKTDLKGMLDEGHIHGFKDRYHVWEYHGPIDTEDMHCLSSLYGDEDLIAYAEEADPLQEINVTVWFCQGEVLKFGIHPLDSGEAIYSVFNYKIDDHSIFGFGVPHVIKNHQQVICAAWRMMVDNAALATAPQIVFNSALVEPYDSDYVIVPGKLWMKKSGVAPGERVFETYHLDMRQAELQAIITMALEAIDREVGVPTIMDVQPGTGPMQTALGISLFSNESKVPFRALVKRFDDMITIPNMRRLFDWNMQFGAEHIKGDMSIKARGTSTFMLRELQAPALMTMIMQFANHPALGPAMKVTEMVRKLAQAMLLRPDEVIKSDEKIAADLAAAAQAEQPEISPEELRAQTEQIKAQAVVDAARLRFEAAKYTADTNREVEMIRLEMQGNVKLDELRTKETMKDKELQSKERQQAADVGLTQRMGRPTGGGWA